MNPTAFLQIFASDITSAEASKSWFTYSDWDVIVSIGTTQIRIARLSKETANGIVEAFNAAITAAQRSEQEEAA